jgi:hypothetical protein
MECVSSAQPGDAMDDKERIHFSLINPAPDCSRVDQRTVHQAYLGNLSRYFNRYVGVRGAKVK